VTSLGAVLAIITTYGSLQQTISTSNSISHSVAVDPTTTWVLVPLSNGIGVYHSAAGTTPVGVFLLGLVLLMNVQ